MARPERVRRDRKVTYTQEELDRAGREMIEVETDRANAVNEDYERMEAESREAFRETLNRQCEEQSAMRWELECLTPQERGQSPDLWSVRNHPGPRQNIIDFLDHDQ